MKICGSIAVSTDYDVCIVGTGPAGVTVALELEKLRPDWKILAVEYGTQPMPHRNGLDDSIIVTNLDNHHPPYECTNKGFGGTSATWGGRCVMYDEVDFSPRKIIGSHCTWELSLLREIRPYVKRAAEILECGIGPFDLADDSERKNSRIAENFLPGDVTDTVVERWSMPTRFGTRYREQLEKSTCVHLLEGWSVCGTMGAEQDGRVEQFRLRSVLQNETVSVTSRYFVIAAGTQETTRLLLENPQLFGNGGNVPDALGKYYQGHVSGKIASVKFYGNPRQTDFGFIREKDGTYIRRRFQFSNEVLMRENLLNIALWLDNPLYFDPAHRSGAMSLMYLAMITPILGKKLAPPAIADSITKGKIKGIPGHIKNVFRGLPASLSTPAAVFFRRYCLRRKLPGVFLYSPENRYALHFHAEQLPHPGNQMRLSADGTNLVIDYHYDDADIDSVIRAHDLLDRWLRKCGCGELEYWFSKDDLPSAIRGMSRDGIHQSGTTRIGRDASEGVVDRDLGLFGARNVFVCSSSVFPTSGQANPTFLLCAFAVRLAHQLSRS